MSYYLNLSVLLFFIGMIPRNAQACMGPAEISLLITLAFVSLALSIVTGVVARKKGLNIWVSLALVPLSFVAYVFIMGGAVSFFKT